MFPKEENSSLLNIESCLALGLIQNSSSKIFQTSKDNLIRDKIWDILDSTSTDHRERNGHLEKGSHSLASTVRPFLLYLYQEYLDKGGRPNEARIDGWVQGGEHQKSIRQSVSA